MIGASRVKILFSELFAAIFTCTLVKGTYVGLIKYIFEPKILIIFLLMNLSMYFGC